jgi:hypothetical protein
MRMSYFLCGLIHFIRQALENEREELAFVLSKAALEQSLYLQLECNIVQTEVFEILNRKNRELSDTDFAFLLTDSPLSNTSDEIVNPNVDPLDKPSVMKQRLRRVEILLSSMNVLDSISDVSLYISLGYDSSYADEEIPIDFLANRVTDLYTELFHIPSTCFKIRFRETE